MFTKSLHRPAARIAAGVLFLGAGITAFAGAASAAPGGGGAAGNNGTVMVNGDNANNGNQPHVSCPIVINWSGFDAAGASASVAFSTQAPTGGSVVVNGPGVTPPGPAFNFTGGGATGTYYLTFVNATPQNNGEYHVGIDINTADANGTDFKQKTVWVKNCGPDLQVTKTANQASAAQGDTVTYGVTVTNNGGPTVGTTTVTDALLAGQDPGSLDFVSGAGATWSCPNNSTTGTVSQNPMCTTTTTLNHGDSATFKVTSKVSTGANPPVSVTDKVTATNGSDSASATASTAVTAAAGTPKVDISKSGTAEVLSGGPVSYTVSISVSGGATTGTTTVSDSLPADFTGGSMSYSTGTGSSTATTASKWSCSGLSCSTSSPLAVGDSVSFTVSATSGGSGKKTDTAKVEWGTSNKTATADTQVDVPLTLSATCSTTSGQAKWTVTNPLSNLGLTSVSNSDGTNLADLASGATETFNTAAPHTADLTVSGKTGGNVIVTSNKASVTGDCTTPVNPNETPATVDFSNTCSGFHVVFTTASLHATQFVVTKPMGGTDTVNGSDQRDYAADARNSHISVAFDGVTKSADWTQPSGCVQPTPTPTPNPSADPGVSASKACKSGITVLLSDMNGTAPVTFTVTKPDGSTETVNVLAGQIVKKSYSVKEDTTGTVTVSAPGLSPKTFTYAKNCTQVLGEKVTKTPTPTPKPTTQVQGEKLPFTGSNTSLFLTLAAILFGSGVLLLVLGARRPQGQHL